MIAVFVVMLSPCVSGRVVDANAGQPVAKAVVYAVWAPIGNAKPQITGDTRSDAQGRYRICVKGDGSALIQAQLGTASAFAQVPSTHGDTVLADLRLPADGDSARAGVSGRVVSEAGNPIVGATVTVLGAPGVAATTSDGSYTLSRMPSGSQVLIVRSIGSDIAITDVDLTADTIRTVNVTMQRVPPTLAVVTIMADRLHLGAVYERIGFTARRQRGNGKFMTMDDIERRHAMETAQLFQGIEGIRVHDNHDDTFRVLDDRGPVTIYANAGQCTAYIVDGSLIGNGRAVTGDLAATHEPLGGSDENMLPPPKDIIAAEIYQAGQPAPLNVGAAERCLKIFLWTKANLRQ